MENQYDVNYFIDKFSKIPEDQWFVGDYHSLDKTQHCAYGHCDLNLEKGNGSILKGTANKEAMYFYKLDKDFNKYFGDYLSLVNDNRSSSYKQSTPKQRILAALNDIKKAQEPKQETIKEIVVYKTVEIDSKVKNLTKQELILN